ncbi:hypothetical protein Pan241w_53170 [Gimesia alba]|uniref:Uncharacterized protein n=1 Tax=Gimesia alba TaxID=2527973 RepID=A0A517RMU7_9PLAN|nr:hypothetical protein [Gimesia alba]QDT45198.1 hypothetical protein Pan241w_53170 [Gimesia alba]
MVAVFALMLFVWMMVMLFLGIRHLSEHGFPRKSKKSRPVSPPPPPDRAERLGQVRAAFEEELRLLQNLNLNDFERNAAILHARQKYTQKIKEILG